MMFCTCLTVVEGVPAEWTAAATATLEPLEQTPTMKQIPTRTAPLVRQPPITSHDTITNRTFRLPFQRTFNVSLERRQRINDAAIEDRNGAKTSAEP